MYIAKYIKLSIMYIVKYIKETKSWKIQDEDNH